ncbi:4'-phosphopantetheinyl transferase family protein [Mesorhizobium sp. B1-1-8]|uniref:4'-phosphopantetheinyl transferase family protein n=1 Tax=Mesorhizobium sp. B1-1-8 TaxID=2589976 RepID=UPI00112E440A|nr:4'-phosphopantetheinyl transferase superfamily protein [Mesorhizobium sp. B1-1-8]UCI07932.1 4'-phosphopantetheinyl transferase superfamily protein [Mesorhizobium sp. B1-1-8]
MAIQPDSAPSELAVAEALKALGPPGLLTGCRRIRGGDEQFLLPAERDSMATRDRKARAASGAGRRIVHELLRRLRCEDVAVLRGPLGSPMWPPGIVGSIAHDEELAVAAVAMRSPSVRSVGVDVEPMLPLPPDLRAVVITSHDRLGNLDQGIGGRLLFAAKEAVYKASFPLDGRMLEFDDISVDLKSGEAATSSGRRLLVRCTARPRILALAYTP